MVEPDFKDLPFSYRFSQSTMIGAVGTLFISKKLLVQQWPIAGKWAIGSVVCAMIMTAMLASSYVVIRYPYLSLVCTKDGDIFERQFTSKFLARLLKIFSLLALALIGTLLGVRQWNANQIEWTQLVSLAYVATLFGFVAYLTLFYDAVLNPTLSTFIRTTLGIGIILIPVFIPILILGSIRCKRLFDSVTFPRDIGT